MQLQGGAKLVRFYINVLEATVTANLKVLYDTQTASTVKRQYSQMTHNVVRFPLSGKDVFGPNPPGHALTPMRQST